MFSTFIQLFVPARSSVTFSVTELRAGTDVGTLRLIATNAVWACTLPASVSGNGATPNTRSASRTVKRRDQQVPVEFTTAQRVLGQSCQILVAKIGRSCGLANDPRVRLSQTTDEVHALPTIWMPGIEGRSSSLSNKIYIPTVLAWHAQDHDVCAECRSLLELAGGQEGCKFPIPVSQ